MAGPNDPTNPYNQANGSTGTDPVSAVVGRAPGSVVKRATNANTGATMGNFGQLQTNDLATMWEMAQNDPDIAAMILRMAQGQTGRPLGLLSGKRDDLYGKAFQTALSLAGVKGFGDIEDVAGDFLSQAVNGNDLMGYGNQMGQKVLGMDWTGIDAPTMQAALKGGLAMQGIGMGGIGQSVNSGFLNDLIYSTLAREIQDKNKSEINFADLLANSPYQRAMQAFGR